jgi:hypothetical protein
MNERLCSNYEPELSTALACVAVFVIRFAHEIIHGTRAQRKDCRVREGGDRILPTRDAEND